MEWGGRKVVSLLVSLLLLVLRPLRLLPLLVLSRRLVAVTKLVGLELRLPSAVPSAVPWKDPAYAKTVLIKVFTRSRHP